MKKMSSNLCYYEIIYKIIFITRGHCKIFITIHETRGHSIKPTHLKSKHFCVN